MQRRNTDQKRVVLQCIDCLGHATMEQVIENVHDIDSSISKSTIYRNVNVLLTENVIKKFKMNQVHQGRNKWAFYGVKMYHFRV